jgi:DNA-binding NtrC family response regulator
MSQKQAIICVDDESIILLSLKQELMSHFGNKFLIETAMNADIALKIIKELDSEDIKIILILSDWLMPGLNGDEFLKIVNKDHPDIKCIILSGHADEKVIDDIRDKINLLAYISKPWNSQELINTISQAVNV